MKSCLLLSALMLTGCYVTPEDINDSENVCAGLGGLKELRMGTFGDQLIVICNDSVVYLKR